MIYYETLLGMSTYWYLTGNFHLIDTSFNMTCSVYTQLLWEQKTRCHQVERRKKMQYIFSSMLKKKEKEKIDHQTTELSSVCILCAANFLTGGVMSLPCNGSSLG